MTADDCLGIEGTPQGEGTVCDPNPCPLPEIGACCLPVGLCIETTEPECVAAGGEFQGIGTDCYTANCSALLGADVNDGGLWIIDHTDASGEFVGPYGSDWTDVLGLAHIPQTGRVVYGALDSGPSSELVAIDVDSGAIVEFVGPIGELADVSGLTFDTVGLYLYGVTRDGLLLLIDPFSAEPTIIGWEVGYILDSLAYDEATGLLYTVANAQNPGYWAELYWIDPLELDPSGVYVGELTGYAEVGGLTFRDGRLWAVTRNDTQRLLEIELSPLTITDHGELPSSGFNGLATFTDGAPQ